MNTEIQKSPEFDDKNFLLIQHELIKILSKTPNIEIEQYHLYDKLISNMKINNNFEYELMKYKFIMVLRHLPLMCENINIKNENNIFSGIFHTSMEDDDIKKEEYVLSKKDFIDLELPEKRTTNTVEVEAETYEENSKSDLEKDIIHHKKNRSDPLFPSETQVIQFIVDYDIKYFLYRKDYQGNTILHNLIINCDAHRIEKLLKTNFFSFLERNNAGKTPLDLITDVKVSNVIHTILYQDLEYYSYKVNNLEMFIEKVDMLFKYIVFSIIMACALLLILLKYF